ncbi:MAG TPA: polyribonucleotide nucleotidyltransferase [Deltaproteobacteria bacterium]|nr:polyribonucleotide nucleotidyltransferase [Deltaproteobacteria bacterium]
MIRRYEIEYGGRALHIEIGKMARQSHGSCTVRYGDTVVLITACRSGSPVEGADFLPLTVNYTEMTYAAGKIPGGFFKREGRPSEKEVLCSRLIDRPLRPLFADGYAYETQVIATVLSVDQENDPEIAALIGASIALGVSDIPFLGPIAAVRVGVVDGELVCNPSLKQQKESELDFIVAGNSGGIIMVEGGAWEVSEDRALEALEYAHRSMQGLIELQSQIISEVGKTKLEVEPERTDPALEARVREVASGKLAEALAVPTKLERYAALDAAKKEVVEALSGEFEEMEAQIKRAFSDLKYEMMRRQVLDEGRRVDGRGHTDIRDITCDVGLLPRTHGSALFTRGETQAMVVTTLGTAEDEQKIDALSGWEYKKFMLHYNFPPFSVGEVRFLRGPGRREIGHGALAERAVTKVLPGEGTDFPYTVRVVSDILESNGSSSMATVCGASLSLMDAGVPVRTHVAGIAMGLIKEGDKVAVLSDILGDEDHLGDMDFKVAGTTDGITALQMDIKTGGLSADILRKALHQAREGRLHILEKMRKAIEAPRKEISTYAPRIITIEIKPEKIKDVIGPGGKVIRSIIQETGVKIDIDDSGPMGKVNIASADEEAAKKAVKIVRELTQEAEVGKLYMGKVKKIVDFGAFIEIFPGTEGLCHISQLERGRVKTVRDVLNEGDEVLVKVLDIDRDGKIRLSRKEALGQTLPAEE